MRHILFNFKQHHPIFSVTCCCRKDMALGYSTAMICEVINFLEMGRVSLCLRNNVGGLGHIPLIVRPGYKITSAHPRCFLPKSLAHHDIRRGRVYIGSGSIEMWGTLGPLIIYASGWGWREIGWVNDFLDSLKVGYIIFFASQRLDAILLIALYWLGSYYFIVHKVG